ncbi:argininosuccinate lyase [Nonomuraea sp. NPDC004354]
MTRPGQHSTDTGRIKGGLSAKAHRLYYGPRDDAGDRETLHLISRVDRAHLVMLAAQGIVPRDKAAVILRTVDKVQADGFSSILARPRPRGLYLAYEQALSELCGSEGGGLLHTARSRNDLNATTTLLGLRTQVLEVLAEGCRLLTALLCSAARHLDTAMVIHTHYQPAMPITYGYYLTGVALALQRDMNRLLHCLRSMRRCPLGAHAVAGTDLPLDTAYTAILLGFDTGPLHAIDAIASRDLAVEALGSAANLAVTVTRLASDLQLWSTAELADLEFPDWLVGSSSAMPQKRNAFLLEYLKARPARVVGAWVAAVTAIKSAPFTNSIEVGTEAMAPIAPALETVRKVLAMAALTVAGARPRPPETGTGKGRDFVDATFLANELVRHGIPFREAHERIGAAVLDAWNGDGEWPPQGMETWDLLAVADRTRYGGGPGSRSEALASAWESRHNLRREITLMRTKEQQASMLLQQAVSAVCDD